MPTQTPVSSGLHEPQTGQPLLDATEKPQELLLPSASLASSGQLPRTLRTRDLLIFCLVAVLLVTNVPLIAGAGGASFLYWILGFVTFLIPSALIAAQLFRLFPGEASVYQWTNRALGNFWDIFLGFFCNWWPGAIGLTVEAGAVVSSVQTLDSRWLSLPWQQGIAELLVLIIAQCLCTLPQRLFQKILSTVFLPTFAMMLLLGWAGIIWVVTGHAIQGDLSLQSWQLHSEQYPLFATVIVALLGVAVPLNMGAEIRHQHSASRALCVATLIIMGGYLLATFGVLMILSPQDLANPAFMTELFERAFGSEFGHFLGVLNSVIMICYFVCATAVYNQMFARFLFAASVDRRLPIRLSHLSGQGVPMNALLAQTGMNMLLVLILFFVAPLFAPSNQHLSYLVFLVIMNGASVVWNSAMIGLFVSAIILFLRAPQQLRQARLAPSWLLYSCSCLGIGAASVAIFSAFFAGSPIPDTLSNQEWGFWVLLVCLVSMAIGAFYSYLMPETEDLASLLNAAHNNKYRRK